MRKLRSDYAGSCLRFRGNVVSTDIDVGFDASTPPRLNKATFASYMVTNPTTTLFHMRTWYDQSVNALNQLSTSGTTGPKLRVEDLAGFAGTSSKSAAAPTAATQGLVSNTAASTGPVNIGGTAKFTAVFSVVVNGFGGGNFGTTAPTSDNPVGTLFGLGASTLEYLSVAEGDYSNGAGEALFGALCYGRDDINTLFERSTTWGRERTVALRFDGNTVSGFIGQTKVFETTLTVAQLTGVRLSLLSLPSLSSTANVEMREAVFYQDAFSDTVTLGIVKEIGTYWNALGATETLDVAVAIWGQSNAANTFSAGWPTIRTALLNGTRLGGNAAIHTLPVNPAGVMQFGGSCIQKGSTTSDANNYWREHPLVAGAPGRGPNATAAFNGIAAAPNRVKPTVGIMVIGEQETAGVVQSPSTPSGTVGNPLFGTVSVAGYKLGIQQEIADMETAMGHSFLGTVILSLGHGEMSDVGADLIRQAQIDLAETSGGTIQFITASADLGLDDVIHWAATDIVSKLAPRVANAIAKIRKAALALNVKGPSISGVAFTDGTKTAIRVTIAHAGGSDISPSTGIDGFRVVDAVGVKTVSSAVREDATHVLVTLSAACSGATTLQYIYGNAWDPTKVVVDNAPVPFPMEASKVLAVA